MSKISERLAAIRARCDAATPGPWHADWEEWECDGGPDCPCHSTDDRMGSVEQCIEPIWRRGADIRGPATVDLGDYDGWRDNDAEFIAHARADLPALLAVAEAAARFVAVVERGDPGFPWWGVDGEDGRLCIGCGGDDEDRGDGDGDWSKVDHLPNCSALALDSALAALGGVP